MKKLHYVFQIDPEHANNRKKDYMIFEIIYLVKNSNILIIYIIFYRYNECFLK